MENRNAESPEAREARNRTSLETRALFSRYAIEALALGETRWVELPNSMYAQRFRKAMYAARRYYLLTDYPVSKIAPRIRISISGSRVGIRAQTATN